MRDLSATQRFLAYFALKSSPPTMAFLEEIVAAFSHFPYENITKIIRRHERPEGPDRFHWPIEIVEGFIEHGAGGTCFSLSYCLQSILDTLDFICYPVMADMNIGENVHCAIVAIVENRSVLIDTGYLLGQPIALPDVHKTLIPSSSGWVELHFVKPNHFDLYSITSQGAKWRYRMKNFPVDQQTFIHHWNISFDLPGLGSVLMTKQTPEGQIYVRNRQFQLITPQGRQNRKIGHETYEETLNSLFGIDSGLVEVARSIVTAQKRHKKQHGLYKPKSTPAPT